MVIAISAVIAAAGLSSRMKNFKPLLCLGSSTIISSTINTLRGAGAEHILVVTGYQSAVLERHLSSCGVMFLKNERFAQTDMLFSVQMGLRALPQDSERIFITPADIPLVSPDTLKQMLLLQNQVVCPLYQGRQGHPLLLTKAAAAHLISWKGTDGIRGWLRQETLDAARLETNDPGIRMDADTPQDYKRLLQYQARLQGHGNLRMDLQLNIGMDELFLTVESVQLLDMIGQTGSIQNACACMHISYSKGWKIINMMERQLGFAVVRRVVGGSDGGGSFLTEKGEQLLNCYQAFHQKLLEDAQRQFSLYFPDYLRSPQGSPAE